MRRVWALDTLRSGCDWFLDRWDRAALPPEARDDLGAEIMLITEWRQLVRAYPDVPRAYLPGDWPVARCEAVVRQRREALGPRARVLFASVVAG